ncbi:hypothetical protein BGZ65_012581 [Modicella reniformis]|uniref:Major facilitator superfamily (MFS) profile domain-containing protein n=1 Tax=Modicella reniformis TaxID=1440133 RepID=A0A9P6IM94_9FUNG|nr:hypothetical protein BGZ65_012581 [Modicella reniformis]
MTIASYCKELLHPTPKTDDPKNWPRSKKNVVVFVIAYCAFVAPLASSIYMPAVNQVKNDLNTTPSLVSATLSVFILFQGIMPIFWASLCDYYGRRPIYLVSMTIFILGSLFAAISYNIWVFFVMRAIQAFGSSSVLAVGGGSLSDIFHSGERGSAFGMYYLGPLIAPMIGPMIGGVIADKAGWRSTMWLLLGTAMVAFLLVLLVLPETYRHHIDEVKTIENDDLPVDATIIRSHIHSTYSDPTLVPSKTSLHDSESSSSSSSSPSRSPNNRVSAPARTRDSPDDCHSIHRTHSHHSRHSYRSQRSHAPVETAMEFIVPDYFPAYMMAEEESPMAVASGSQSSAAGTKEESTGNKISDINSCNNSDVHATEERHVVFPCNLDNEKQDMESKRDTARPKRKPFNPLRPLVCLLQPANALLIGSNALSIGAQFCVNNTLPITFGELYHLRESMIGVCFCVAGLGSVVGSLLGGRYSDYVMRKWLIKQELKRQRDQRDCEAVFGGRNNAPSIATATAAEMNEKKAPVISVTMGAPPEIRLRSVWIGVFALPLGLLLFGWSLQNGLPIVAPLVGIFFVGFGLMMVFSSTTTALVDANSENNMATSALACNSFARGLVAAIGGFTALPLLDAIGNAWLYTFWAFVTIVGSSGLVLMVLKAKSWREKAAEKALNRV